MNLTTIGNTWFPDSPGGLDRYMYDLVHHLATPETTVNFCGVGLPSEHAASPSIRLINLANPADSLNHRLYSAYRTLRSLPALQSQAINIQFALYGMAALPHLPKDIPITCTFHGPWALESQQEGGSHVSVWTKKKMEQLVYGRCDRFIVLSKAFGEILHQEYGVACEKIHVIPGGVDTQRFQNNLSRQQAREELGWPKDRFIIFTPRRLVHRMGLSTLLRVIASLRAGNRDLLLAIAGKGPLRKVLEQEATELGLDNEVTFLGFVPDEALPTAYQAADLTIIPSQSLEGFGLVILESLASGTPVLCTPVGGMPEVIEDFSASLISRAASEQAIAATLSDVLAGNIRLPTRDACHTYAATRFGWPAIAQRVKETLLL